MLQLNARDTLKFECQLRIVSISIYSISGCYRIRIDLILTIRLNNRIDLSHMQHEWLWINQRNLFISQPLEMLPHRSTAAVLLCAIK